MWLAGTQPGRPFDRFQTRQHIGNQQGGLIHSFVHFPITSNEWLSHIRLQIKDEAIITTNCRIIPITSIEI
jgi:hypothetical protein